MPKFLVLGATGYIGAPLAAALVANDNVVYGVCCFPVPN
jgi:nucleoside-diphosphate-sugar epimerase